MHAILYTVANRPIHHEVLYYVSMVVDTFASELNTSVWDLLMSQSATLKHDEVDGMIADLNEPERIRLSAALYHNLDTVPYLDG